MRYYLNDNLQACRKETPSIGRHKFPMTIQDRIVQSNETGGILMRSLRSSGERVNSFIYFNTIYAGKFCPAKIFPISYRTRQIS